VPISVFVHTGCVQLLPWSVFDTGAVGLHIGGGAGAIAVSIGSEPQEILPDDRAWGSRIPGVRRR
jgi:hypothetical protein